MGFKYNKILIIGATSGIGHAMAVKCLAEGISVVAVGRRKDRLDAFELAHHGTSSATASSIQFDITDLPAIPQFAKNVRAKHPDVDAVLINSGVQRPVDWTDASNINVADIDLEILTNYTAYMHLTVALLPLLQSQAPKPTCLLYTSSGLALVPLLPIPNYCATKAALHHHCLALRMQLKSQPNNNVKVVEILPPAVQTEMQVSKNQASGRSRAMPMSEFIEATWQGLNEDGARGEELYIGQSKFLSGDGHDGGWEMVRQRIFGKLTDIIRATHE